MTGRMTGPIWDAYGRYDSELLATIAQQRADIAALVDCVEALNFWIDCQDDGIDELCDEASETALNTTLAIEPILARYRKEVQEVQGAE